MIGMGVNCGIKINADASRLTITIDLEQEHGPSKSGKTIVIASTKGNVQPAPGIYLGVNCYKYVSDKEDDNV